ncbi:putative protein kinase CAMK-CDPK family [Helianthus annuus]|nr:putative protein kinase CAMK-CDPK family [Helianthus annuus]
MFCFVIGSNSENDQQPDDAIEVFSPPHETDLKYTLGEKLGEGTFGETYMCTHTLTDGVFACKTVNKCLAKAYDANMKREITIMKKFSHPNIATLNDSYQDDDTFYIVMELCSGGMLGDHMKLMGRYAETEAASIIRQVVEALKVNLCLCESLYSEHAGTSYYKAPKFFMEKDYCPNVGIWSVGVILYELLSLVKCDADEVGFYVFKNYCK